MSETDILLKLRKSLSDAVKVGLIKEDNAVMESTLVSIFNECKKQELRCNQLHAEYLKNAASAESQKNAYIQMQSIVYAVFNGYVQNAQRDIDENKRDIDENKDGLTLSEILEEKTWRENKLQDDLKKKEEERLSKIPGNKVKVKNKV